MGDTSAGRFTMSQDSSAPDGFANSLKIATTTADTSIAAGEKLVLQTKIEGQNAQTFAKGTSSAKPMALSFYVKGNASATYVAEIFDENDRQCSKTFNVTTDWTRIKLSFPADTTGTLDDDNATSLFINFHLHGGSNFTSGTLNSSSFAAVTQANRAVGISSIYDSTARTFFITGVQLEVGQNCTEFEHEPFGETLRKCQRYLEIQKPSSSGGTCIFGTGYNESTSDSRGMIDFKEEKRAAPSVSVDAHTNFANVSTGSTAALESIAFNGIQTFNCRYVAKSSNTTLVDGGAATLMNFANQGTITIDAEL